MKKHTRLYLEKMGYDETDFIKCELCSSEAVDIHHLEPRGMGGSKEKDYISNLMALCRRHHDMAEAKKLTRTHLMDRHLVFIIRRQGKDKLAKKPR